MEEIELKQQALAYHSEPTAGNLVTTHKKNLVSSSDFKLAYSPGVAYPCKEIFKDSENVYKYTNKGNLVAVISNGTAVLGLGNIGPLAAKPTMEGKAVLMKKLANIDSFDIEIANEDPIKVIEIVIAISKTFGAINLEDIKAPECFQIEEFLYNNLDIPIMHDDQHGTAIVVLAALLNALELVGKKFEDVKILISGAGAAAIACVKLLLSMKVKKEHIIMFDSKGVINNNRKDLSSYKREFATDLNFNNIHEAIIGMDVFLGLSVERLLSVIDIKNMSDNPIVFGLANPNPEINYIEAKKSKPGVIAATGRSDFPNQINNILAFPYIYRGALDVRASKINTEMKISAAKAIASVAKEPVDKSVKKIYPNDNLEFGFDYILPKFVDPRLLVEVSSAVAKAAVDSGVSKSSIFDFEKYKQSLRVK